MKSVTFGDWTLRPDWTQPRAHGLKVLAVHGIAQCSTIFSTGMMPPTVHRTTALWLQGRGLATLIPDGLATRVELTDAGRTFIRILDNAARASA